MVTPTTVKPCDTSRAAATEESTPPLIATAIVSLRIPAIMCLPLENTRPFHKVLRQPSDTSIDRQLR